MAALPLAGALFTKRGRRLLKVIAGMTVAGIFGLAAFLTMLLTASSVPGWSWTTGGCEYDAGTDSLTVTNGSRSIDLGAGQLQNAATILAIGQDLGLPAAAGKIALMTGLQESSLKMLANTSVPESVSFPHEGVGEDHDSVNVFQQRPHWGTIAELMNLDYAARAFFGGPNGPNHGSPAGLADIDGWEQMGLGEAAQAVQVSSFPDHYDGWAAAADQIITAINGGKTCDPSTTPTGDGRDGWGGHENGRIPTNEMTAIPWAPGSLLREDATAALTAMNEAWKTRFGYDIQINDAYRDYQGQVEAREYWCARNNCGNASEPGESNHGWALAIDVAVNFGDAEYAWLKQNAESFGWVHPAWAEPEGEHPESWHWEYAGLSQT